MDKENLLLHTANVSAAFLSHNQVPVGEVGAAIAAIGLALAGLGEPVPETDTKPTPAANPRTSIKPGYLVSMIDGKHYKMLKRHVALHGYTPETYREAYGLPANYPMVAPDYAQRRRELAVKIGLGRMPGQARGRRRKAA